MDYNSYRFWEFKKVFNELMQESSGTSGKKPYPYNPLASFNPANLQPSHLWNYPPPSFKVWMKHIADELELPHPIPPQAEKALEKILVRLTPEPLGKGGMVMLAWFEIVIHAIVDAHEKKHGKIIPHSAEILQARNPVQLLRTLKTLMPDEKFNQKAYLEGNLGSADPDANDAYFIHQSNLADERIGQRIYPPAATALSTPSSGKKKKGKKGSQASGGGSGSGSPAPGTGPVSSPTGSSLSIEDIMLAMPDRSFYDNGKLLDDADIIDLANNMSRNLSLPPSNWGVSEVHKFIRKKGLKTIP